MCELYNSIHNKLQKQKKKTNQKIEQHKIDIYILD